MSKLTVEEVKAAVEKLHKTVTRCEWIDDSALDENDKPVGYCPLSFAYVLRHGETLDEDEVEEWARQYYGNDYVSAFLEGYDDKMDCFVEHYGAPPSREDFDTDEGYMMACDHYVLTKEGFTDGVTLRKAFFPE